MWACSRMRLLRKALVYLACSVAACSSTCAMEFTVRFAEGSDASAIFADGPIVEGDAERFQSLASKTGRDQFGNILVYLNSPGGSVAAAFELVRLMDDIEVTAIVGSGEECVSACSAIVFLSARLHLVVGTGRLGFHTCYMRDKAGAAETLPRCNEAIIQNAVDHGTSYGALSTSFLNPSGYYGSRAGPDNAVWVGEDYACAMGLCGPPGFDDTLAVPSFDCGKARSEVETAICADKRLARHEASLAKKYRETFGRLPVDAQLVFKAEQRAWLKSRDQCSGEGLADCVIESIEKRREEVWEWGRRYRS